MRRYHGPVGHVPDGKLTDTVLNGTAGVIVYLPSASVTANCRAAVTRTPAMPCSPASSTPFPFASRNTVPEAECAPGKSSGSSFGGWTASAGAAGAASMFAPSAQATATTAANPIHLIHFMALSSIVVTCRILARTTQSDKRLPARAGSDRMLPIVPSSFDHMRGTTCPQTRR